MNNATNNRPVLIIGIDAASRDLIEQWMADGTLPNLARLRQRGAYGPIASEAKWFASSVWLSFASGTPPQDNGNYFYMQWRADEMRPKRLEPERFIYEPFWWDLDAKGKRVIAVDVPYAYAPTSFNGLELYGWATHDSIFPPFAHPASLERWIKQQFGDTAHKLGAAMADELYVPQPLEDLLRIRDGLVETTQQMADLSTALMREHDWDLFLSVFGTVHRAGHLLWDAGGVSDADESTDRAMMDAHRDIYIAADKALGQIVDAAPDDARIWICSLHGMRQNNSRIDVLPQMLERVIAGGPPADQAPSKPGLVKKLRNLVPLKWRNAVKSRLPYALQDKLSIFWKMGRVDWSQTKAVGLYGDVNGYVRFNVRGREAEGVVEPGDELETLTAAVIEGLKTYVDADTGQPLVSEIRRRDELFSDGARRDELPDLIVRWTDSYAANHRQISSPKYGTIDWPAPGKMPNGRSGNHDDKAFFMVVDDDVAADAAMDDINVVDLPTTIYALLDQAPPAHMKGKCLGVYK